jgi:cell division protein FtsA
VLYSEGAVRQSGCLAVGGDHITNDISMGLRIPMARSEKLKTEEGSCVLGNCLPGEMILLKDDSGFAGKEIERETLNTIIHLRLREAFDLLKRRLEEESYLGYLGAGIFITGGCSLLSGIDHLAEEIFEVPANLTHAQAAWGVTSAVENPQFSTAIGLVKFAQVMHTDRPPRRFGRIFGRIFSGKR